MGRGDGSMALLKFATPADDFVWVSLGFRVGFGFGPKTEINLSLKI